MKRLAKMAIYALLMLTAITSYAGIDVKQFNDVKMRPVFEDSLSYSMGYLTGYKIWKDTLPINKELFLRGMADGLDSNGRGKYRMLDQKQMDKAFVKFDSIRMAQRQKEIEAKDALRKKRGEELLVQGSKFLSENAKLPGVKVTESGLQYKVIIEGTGRKPTREDAVEVNFVGKLTDGTVFTDTYHPKDPKMPPKPAIIPLDRIPPGWAEGIMLMPMGSKYILFIPSDLAFGEKGMIQNQQDLIPPNAVLIMEMELINIHDKSTLVDPNAGRGPQTTPPPNSMNPNQGPPKQPTNNMRPVPTPTGNPK